MYGTMETQCTNCIHKEICVYKEQYLRAQEAVNKTFVATDDMEGVYLRDIKWIQPVKLSCVHFYVNTLTVRGNTIQGIVDPPITLL